MTCVMVRTCGRVVEDQHPLLLRDLHVDFVGATVVSVRALAERVFTRFSARGETIVLCSVGERIEEPSEARVKREQ